MGLPVAGKLLEIKVAEDETVEVGAELAIIGSADAAPAASAPEAPAPEAAPEPAPASAPAAADSNTYWLSTLAGACPVLLETVCHGTSPEVLR